ncbi:MAG: hypothetical protein ABNH02_12095 [Pseudomonadales bacterium]|jgi:hypothetical protein
MILRKLAAATIASTVLASGAFAATTDSADVTLTVAQVTDVAIEAGTIAFTGAASGATANHAVCTYSNANDYEITVTTTNSFTIVNGDGTAVGYSLTVNGNAPDVNGKIAKADLNTAAASCAGTPSYDNAMVATLTATATEAGSYTDEITVSIGAI